jgi:hypothetical protein
MKVWSELNCNQKIALAVVLTLGIIVSVGILTNGYAFVLN